MQIAFTLLNLFLALLQNYILFAVGMIAYSKKIFSTKSAESLSKLLLNFLFPIYATIQLANVATWPNIYIMWLFLVSTTIAILMGYLTGLIAINMFQVDERIKLSFLYINAYPSLGSLSFVIGKSMCSNGNFLNSDPLCINMQGYMVLNFLFYQLSIFAIGFILMSKEVDNANLINEKLGYLWHILIPDISNNKNYTVLYFFTKYIKKSKKNKIDHIRTLFENFDSKYKLIMRIDREEFIYELIDNKNIKISEVEESIYINEEEIAIQPNQLFPHKESNQINVQIIKEEEEEEHVNIVHDIEQEIDELPIPLDERKQIELTNVIDRKEAKENIEHEYKEVLSRSNELSLDNQKIMFYYDKLFCFVEHFIDSNDKILLDNYITEKETILQNLRTNVPKFPIVKSVQIHKQSIKLIDITWETYSNIAIKLDPEFHLMVKTFKISIMTILNKLYAPPIIGSILGLIIGMSGMREVLFSQNHYISNLVYGINVAIQATIPFLYVTLGLLMMSVKKINLTNSQITKKYVVISFILRFVILPSFGLLYIYLWKISYGGIVAESKVIRFSIFISFCLPITPVVIIIIDIVNYFRQESGLILFAQNISLVITLTFLYLIYYVVIEG